MYYVWTWISDLYTDALSGLPDFIDWWESANSSKSVKSVCNISIIWVFRFLIPCDRWCKNCNTKPRSDRYLKKEPKEGAEKRSRNISDKKNSKWQSADDNRLIHLQLRWLPVYGECFFLREVLKKWQFGHFNSQR